MSPMPDKAVVIPVRNEATRISECIDAILSLTVPVQEIIVVDLDRRVGRWIFFRTTRVRVLQISHDESDHG